MQICLCVFFPDTWKWGCLLASKATLMEWSWQSCLFCSRTCMGSRTCFTCVFLDKNDILFPADFIHPICLQCEREQKCHSEIWFLPWFCDPHTLASYWLLPVDGAECDALHWRPSRRMSQNPQLEVWVIRIALWAETTSLCDYLTLHDSSWFFFHFLFVLLQFFFCLFGCAHCDYQRSSSHSLLSCCHSLDLSSVTSPPAVLLLSLTLPLRLSILWRFCF